MNTEGMNTIAQAKEVPAIEKRKVVTATRVATSVDVAKVAGVSQATVSRAFNAESKLSPETRRRVLDVARALGYYPNAIARSLVSKKTNIVGIIQMSGESPFYTYLINELVVAWRQRGYYSMLIRQEEGETGDATVLRALEQAPPALAADVYDNGLLMAGGGALLRGLDQCIARATHLKVAVDKDPLTTVLRGTAQAMLYREDYEGIFIN